MCGISQQRYDITEKEIKDLNGLKRGVFTKVKIKKGEKINSNSLFLAIPCTDNQVLANDLSKYTEYTAIKNIEIDKPVLFNDVDIKNKREKILKYQKILIIY